MNKKLIALAVAAGMAAPIAAQAEITTYAHVQFEVTDTDVDGSDSTTRVTDNQRGRFGVKGGHDLGGGLKSFAVAEFDFEGGANDAEFGNNSNGNARAAFRVREINAGLKGGFGKIALGTIRSAYKYAGGVKYDPFVTTQLEARGVGMEGGADGHNAFLNNGFAYSNKFGMAKLAVTYSLDDTDRDADGNGDDGEMSAALTFGNKKWEAGIAMYDEGNSVSAGSQENMKLFGKMKFGAHTVLGQYEDNDTGNGGDREYIWLGYQLKMGKGMLNAQYATFDATGANDHDMMTVGYIHKFNKKTRVFAGYQTVDFDAANSDTDQISFGVRVDI